MYLVEYNRNVCLSYGLYFFFKCYVVYGKGFFIDGIVLFFYTDHVIQLVKCVSLVLVGLGYHVICFLMCWLV
ncbi:hypothetical protein Hanom_Chr10g00877831 [Helianthus anomalus]